ncbi:protein of unknown function (plasmid) [Pararobbsia alpina]
MRKLKLATHLHNYVSHRRTCVLSLAMGMGLRRWERVVNRKTDDSKSLCSIREIRYAKNGSIEPAWNAICANRVDGYMAASQGSAARENTLAGFLTVRSLLRVGTSLQRASDESTRKREVG